MGELTQPLSIDREIVDTLEALEGGTLPEVYRRLSAESGRPQYRGQQVAMRWHRLVEAGVLEERGETVHVGDRSALGQPQSST